MKLLAYRRQNTSLAVYPVGRWKQGKGPVPPLTVLMAATPVQFNCQNHIFQLLPHIPSDNNERFRILGRTW
jgi:hypothetical protein